MTSQSDKSVSPEIGKLLELLDVFEEQDSLAPESFAALERLLAAGRDGAQDLVGPEVDHPALMSPEDDHPDLVGPEVDHADLVSPEGDHPELVSREDDRPDLAGPAVGHPDLVSSEVDHPAEPSLEQHEADSDDWVADAEEQAARNEHIAHPTPLRDAQALADENESIENRFAAHIVHGMWKTKND